MINGGPSHHQAFPGNNNYPLNRGVTDNTQALLEELAADSFDFENADCRLQNQFLPSFIRGTNMDPMSSHENDIQLRTMKNSKGFMRAAEKLTNGNAIPDLQRRKTLGNSSMDKGSNNYTRVSDDCHPAAFSPVQCSSYDCIEKEREYIRRLKRLKIQNKKLLKSLS
jgi:hypothetical protein